PMAPSPSLLLLLSLALRCCGIQGQGSVFAVRFWDGKITQPREGQRLALECRPGYSNVGVSWIKQDPGGSLHFIAFVNALSGVTYKGNERTSRRFEAAKQSSSFRLVVKSFSEQDQGTYFCLVNSNQMLHFSTGQAAFLPGQQHLCPPVCISSSLSLPPAETSKETLDFSCSIFIWVPLACSCLVFLIALVITIALCQSKGPRLTPMPQAGKPKAQPCPPNPRT
uniref:CD8 subunit alpha n=1 Tax=Nothoprocta perdicaria TaxID=30464 RepID=A0A8C6YMQ7_NOTPE